MSIKIENKENSCKYGFLVKNCYVNNDIENILKNISDIENIKNIVNDNLNKSKILLNDIENISDIDYYLKDFGYNYNSNIIEKNNLYDISFKNIDYYNRNSFIKNSENPIILKEIPKKLFFIDFLENIQTIIYSIIEYLKDNITYKKHIIKLNDIEQFLNTDFLENIYYNYSYNNKYYNDMFKKYVNIKLLNNFENNPKNIYKMLKYTFNKILKIIYNIIENNIL